MAPSPIQMPTGNFASELASGQLASSAVGGSSSVGAGGGPMSLPQSPGGRSSFLPSFTTGESLNSPPTFYFDRQQPSQPISSESLLGSGGPSSPGLGGSSSARRQQQQQQQRGNLPSPPLSSSHREDPLVNFGQRLMRRISNQGGSSSNSGGGGLPTIASSGAASGGISPSRSAGGGATPVSHQRSTSTSPTTATTAAGRSTGAGGPDESRSSLAPVNDSAISTGANAEASSSTSAPVHRLRLVPLLEASNSLPFDPVVRDVPETFDPTLAGAVSDQPAHSLRIGRFTDKQSGVDGVPRGGALNSNKVAFKSKVVSRIHAELWVLEGGRFFVRDTKSSSGTFLNHQRLSPPGQESRPFAIKDGDILQLGVDYQGGTEEIYKCVKMRAEIGRGWQTGANNFNMAALKQLQALGGGGATGSQAATPSKGKKVVKASTADCCICLFCVTICQSLFIAPCSHVFHYKCIRPLLEQHHPGFSCPVCRSFADLEADVETDEAFDMASRRESLVSRRGSLKSVKAAFDQGLADALGVGPEPPRSDSDDDEQPREPVVWDGGLTPGATPGLAVVAGHSFGDHIDGGLATYGAPADSVPPIPELECLTMNPPLSMIEPGLSPAESVRAAALAGPSSSVAAALNPSSASLTDVGGGPSSPLAAPASSNGPKPAIESLDSEAHSGANTSSTSPDAGKDAPLVALDQGSGGSSGAAEASQ